VHRCKILKQLEPDLVSDIKNVSRFGITLPSQISHRILNKYIKDIDLDKEIRQRVK